MNLPHLFGTRRVGPDLIREAGKHSNDWHMAHLFDPRSVAPYSVMPSYPWFFDAERRPTERALALVAYLQWLGSWAEKRPGNDLRRAPGGGLGRGESHCHGPTSRSHQTGCSGRMG